MPIFPSSISCLQTGLIGSASGQYTKVDPEAFQIAARRVATGGGLRRRHINLALVDANWKEGQDRYKVNSTLSFFINGTPHGPWSMMIEESFDDLIKK